MTSPAPLWLALHDGLQFQRVSLHLAEWRQVATQGAAVPGLPSTYDAATLAATPSAPPSPVTASLRTAGLEPWVTVPVRHGITAALVNPLAGPAEETGRQIAGDASDIWAEAARSVSRASAWWIGFFTLIRHRGVHHSLLTPVTGVVASEAIQEAARVLALGLSLRVVEAHLREEPDVMPARRAYCRALTASMALEGRMPLLLEELGELRLVDLVSASIPWRGRFTKFAGGTGPGQVEP